MATLAARIAAAASGGAVLYYVAVVFLGGVLAAVAIPREYFAFFGRQHAAVAAAVLNFATWALPVSLAVFAGAYALIRLAGGSRAAYVSAALGMLACFFYWQATSIASLLSHPESSLSLAQASALIMWPYWWTAPNALAPWFGLTLAIWLVRAHTRGSHPRQI